MTVPRPEGSLGPARAPLSGPAIRAVVVDVDDTLVLTEAICFDLENDVLRRIGRAPMSRDVHRSTWGRPLLDAMRDRSPGLDIDTFAGVYPDAMGEYIAAGRLDVVPEENLAALDELSRAGLQIMLLTSRTGAEVEHLLTADHVLAGRIACVYHAGNMRYQKPDPRAFDELLANSGLTPAECIYVGDSPTDAEAANGAGLRFVATLQSGLRRSTDFAGHRVDAFIDTFPDIVSAIDSLATQARTD